MSGVTFDIWEEIKLFTSISPLLTGVLSDLISFVRPCFLRSKETLPAYKKVSTRLSTISLILISLKMRAQTMK